MCKFNITSFYPTVDLGDISIYYKCLECVRKSFSNSYYNKINVLYIGNICLLHKFSISSFYHAIDLDDISIYYKYLVCVRNALSNLCEIYVS